MSMFACVKPINVWSHGSHLHSCWFTDNIESLIQINTHSRTFYREEAELEYLRVAQDLEMYGVNYFEITVRSLLNNLIS